MRSIRALLTGAAALAMMLVAAPAASADPATRTEQPVTLLVTNPCNGDVALVEGTQTNIERLRPDGRLDVRVLTDASGTGQLTGDEYRLRIDTGSRSVPEKGTFRFGQRFVVDNRSGGPDFTAVFRLRIVDGVVTSTVDDQRCK